MENGTKLRILYLYQHLVQHTDAEHTLSTAELMKILKEDYSVKVSRNTISDDLAMLHDCGLHIEHYESTQNKYYYDGHIYELPELKVLVDAISSSKFITHRKSVELIANIHRMLRNSAVIFTLPVVQNQTMKTDTTSSMPSMMRLIPRERYLSVIRILT